MPPPRHGPTTLDTSRLTISGAPVRRRRWRDNAGNTVVRLVADHVEEYLEFAYSATLTRRRDGASVLLDPHMLGSASLAAGDALTAASDPLRALAAVSPPSGHGPFDRLTGLALADALCQVTYDALALRVRRDRRPHDGRPGGRARPRRLSGLRPHHAGAVPDPWPARPVRLGPPRRPGRDPRVGRGARAVGRRPRGGGGGVRPVQRPAHRCRSRHRGDRSRLPRRASDVRAPTWAPPPAA